MAGLFHRRNGIALIVLLAVVLTVAILIILKPTTQTQYIMYSVIICVLWLIPSIMYYMLILNYKKTITTNVIPDIVVSLTKTLQSMYDCDKYNDKQKDIIGRVACETIVKSSMKKYSDTIDDVATVMDSVVDSSPELVTENTLKETYGIVESTQVAPTPTPEETAIVAKTLTESKKQLGAAEYRRNIGASLISEISAKANARKERVADMDIDQEIQSRKRPVDLDSPLKKQILARRAYIVEEPMDDLTTDYTD